jgi:NitT/TauT family transport system substrate-binding protein
MEGVELTELRLIASRHSAFYSPLICTIAGGFLEKNGLSGTYRPVGAGENSVTEVASGRMDVGQSAVSGSWGYLERGEKPPVAHFAQINRHDGFFIAAREPDSAFDWNKLLNGKFMYVHGGQPEAMLRYAAFKKGVDLSDVPDINIPSTGDMMDRWRDGEGDYFHEQGSYPQQLKHEGKAHIVASVGEAIGPVAFSSLVCRWDWLYTDEAKQFSDAYRESREWVNTEDPMKVAQAEASYFPDHNVSAIAEAIEAYQKLGCWSGDIIVERPLYETALDVFLHSKLITKRHLYADVVVAPPER